MSRSILVIISLCLILVSGSLPAQTATQAANLKEFPDVTLPPDLDRVLRDYERAWLAGDAAALASLFTEDGVALQNNKPPIRGRAAIQAAYEHQGSSRLRLRALSFDVGEEIGYIIGAYHFGNDPSDIGKFTLTLHRMPRQPWLISSDMDNLNASTK
jgi:ketosteroid isomerase-like protein